MVQWHVAAKARALRLDVKAEKPKEPNAKLFLLHL